MPPPFNPATGTFAPLVKKGDYPYCAMFQVAAEDTHDNYVICRGYDPRIKRSWLYEEGDEVKTGIAVAKPYGNRQAGVYQVGQVFPAVLPLMKIGQNPGVAAESQGHPADLDEVVEILYTEEGKAVSWLLLDSAVPDTVAFRPDAEVPAYGIVIVDTSTEVQETSGERVLPVTQNGQAAGFGKIRIINGPDICSADTTGRGSYGDEPTLALYDTADGTPAVGEVWGLGVDSWKLRKYLPGYLVLQAGSGGEVLVQRLPFVHVWCKNDAAIAYNESTGVTCSVWRHDWTADVTGQDLELVLPPPQFTAAGEGEIAITSFVRVAVRSDGRYYVDLAPC